MCDLKQKIQQLELEIAFDQMVLEQHQNALKAHFTPKVVLFFIGTGLCSGFFFARKKKLSVALKQIISMMTIASRWQQKLKKLTMGLSASQNQSKNRAGNDRIT